MNLKMQLENQERLNKKILSEKKPIRTYLKRSTLGARSIGPNEGMKDIDINTLNHEKPGIPRPNIHRK